MKLFDVEKQRAFEAQIREMEEEDYEKISASKQFQFDWSQERENRVYKIVAANETENAAILGLISITDFPAEFRTHINLIENSNDNKGKNKQIDRIAGCLLAFAVRLSFEKGYAGFTSLIPKTVLIDLYVKNTVLRNMGDN